jgi:PHD/YefM family antitoxin component YafN of YafNO toxin-antitoxin module
MDSISQDIQYVIGAEGKPTAVLVDISTWEHILDALEDAEDIALVREALSALDAVGGDFEIASFIAWEKAKAKLGQLDDSEK